MDSSARRCPRCGEIVTGSRNDALCPVCLLESALGDSLAATGETSANPGMWATSLRLPEPPPQLRYFGDYELVGELARGGMGIVYLARQTSLDRLVAVKLLLFGGLSSASFIQRFRIEASAAARLQHPGIVGIFEIGEHEGQHFFSMEYVPGENLAQRVIRQPPSPREAAALLTDVSAAVHFAHAHGILHRDLKPANVLVDASGRARVTDFGLAKRLDKNSELTVTGEVLGSPCFMAPEQVRGDSARIGVTADVYGLGAMLYHALTGRPPLQASTIAATLDLVLQQEPLSPRNLNPSVPRDLETICLKCLAKAPTQRYPDAAALEDDLQRFLRGEPIAARPAGRVERCWRWARRRPALAGVLTLAALLVLTLTGGGLWYGRQQEAAGQRESALRAESEQQRYAMSINLAERARSEGDFAQADKLLAGAVPRPGDADLRGWEWYHLRHELRGREERIVWSGTNEILGLAANLRGDRLAVLFSQQLKLLNVSNGAVLGEWPLPEDVNNRSAVFTPEGSGVVVGAISGAVLFQPGEPPRALLTEPANVLAFSPDGSRLAFSSVDIEVSMDAPVRAGVLHLATDRVQHRMETNGGPGLSWIRPAGGGEEQLLILGSRGQLNRWVFGKDSPAQLQPIWGRLHFTDFAAFSPDNRQVVFDDVRGFFDWYTITNSAPSLPEPAPRLRIPWSITRPAVAFSADGSRVAIKKGADRRIAVCETTTGEVLNRYPGHRGELTGLVFLGDSQVLASSSRDGTIRLWDTTVTPGNFRITNNLSRFFLPQPVFTRDSKRVAMTTRYIGTNDTFAIIRLPEKLVQTVTNGIPLGFVSDNDSVLLWHDSGELSIYNNNTNRFIQVPGRHASKDWDTLTADGRFLIARERGDICVSYDLKNNAKHEIFGTNMAFFSSAPTRSLVAMMTPDGVCLWNPVKHEKTLLIGRDARALRFSADSRLLAVGDVTGSLTVLNPSSAKIVAEFSGHGGEITVVAFSPDGRTILSAAEDRTLRFWNVLTSTSLMVRAMPENIHWLSFSPDGQWLVAGWDGAFEIIEAPGAAAGPPPANPMLVE